MNETNKDKSTEMFAPLLLNHLINAHVPCNAESKKWSAKVSNFKEDDSALPI